MGLNTNQASKHKQSSITHTKKITCIKNERKTNANPQVNKKASSITKNKKAIYFTTDAFFAAIIIIGGLLLINQMVIQEKDVTHIDFIAKDLLVALDQIPITSIDHPAIPIEIANGNIKTDNSVLEQIAAYWALNETAKARGLTEFILNDTLPIEVGARITMTPDTIFEQTHQNQEIVVASTRMVSGIDKDKPLDGSSSYGYLRSITDKRSSAYAYFGGFVGQGNVTVKLEQIPQDVTSERITSMLLEADIQKEFNISINNQNCGNFTPTIGNFTASLWDITHCNTSITAGTNNISLLFSDLNDAFIGGGYIRVDYETDTFYIPRNYTITNYTFPQISGIVNLFDSFYVAGTLNELTLYINYFANHTNTTNNPFYITIGNTTVYEDTNSTTAQSITLSNTYLSSLLNYSLFSNTTVPLRVGFENLTYESEFIGNADVVLITDVSGSMNRNFTHTSGNGVKRNCDDPQINELSSRRISVAKCLDKDFSSSILNVTGNLVGLVSYDGGTDSTLDLTTNLTAIYDEIGMGVGSPEGYVGSGSTCICCGINSAADMLSEDMQITTLIASQSLWNYSNQSLDGDIPNDASNNSWFDKVYLLEANWSSANAVLGYDAGGGGVTVDSEIGQSLIGSSNKVDLWELAIDAGSIEVDFTSGLNSTANTYGINESNDGWDWSSGTFDYSSSFTTFDVYNGRLRMVTPSSSSSDTSGAFAVSINITQELYDTLLANGSATLSFEYSWDDYRNYFESSDQVWLKGRWSSPYSGETYLGTDVDSSHNNGDATPEIDARDDPDVDIVNEYYAQDMKDLIEGPGIYYLELGGKLRRSASNEWGRFYYDNILLTINNKTDHYYFRKHFTINDLSTAQRGVLNILADETVSAYLNSNLLFAHGKAANGTYWDINGFNIPGEYFTTQENVIAIELKNTQADAKFDLELLAINDSKQKSLFVMTDGIATSECSQQGWTDDLDGDGYTDTASDDAIQAACDAAQDYGITVYAVGFSDSADEPTLQGMADCGNGLYRKSQNTSELQIFYQDVVLNILELSRQSQTILVSSGTPDDSEIFDDSYILINHTSAIANPSQNEIELVFQTQQFDACEINVTINEGLRISDAKVTSYSSQHWTSLVTVDNITVFNLSTYNQNYTRLGDPYIVQIPPHLLTAGQHQIGIFTGDDSTNTTGCSLNNTLIYTAFINSSTTHTDVVNTAQGCNWLVDFEDEANQTFTVPQAYNGTNNCTFTNTSLNYNQNDAYDIAVYNLLSSLDFDNDHRVFINLNNEDLEIIVTLVNEIPFLWGPALVEIEVWQ